MVETEEILGQFLGDDAFPVAWDSDVEQRLFWVYDDLHIPNPVSPMFFDIGGWWLSCDHMFRRFGTPFAVDWLAKNVNGYVYTTAIPADPAMRDRRHRVQRPLRGPGPARRRLRRARWAATSTSSCRSTAPTSPTGGATASSPRCSATSRSSRRGSTRPTRMGLAEVAVLLEDAIDVHDRHWKIHWMLNFAQLSATLNLRAVMEKTRGTVDEELLGRLQNSASDRNWDSIEALWRMKNEVRDDPELRAAFGNGEAGAIAAALRGSERGRTFIAERIEPYQREFGWHAVWSHEFVYPTVREQMEPVLDLIRDYVASDYDFPTAIGAMRRDIEAASVEILDGLTGRRPRRDARGQRDEPADGAAHARPPLLHRPGRQRARPPGADGDRPQAGRGRAPGRGRRRDVPALQRAADADRRRGGGRRARSRRHAAGRARGVRRRSSPATGSAPRRRRSWRSPTS